MSKISIKNFVDVNIQPRKSQPILGTRDTVALYTSEVYSGSMTMPLKSLEDAQLYCGSTMPNTLAYLTVYFNNGGSKAVVIPNTASSAISSVIDDLDDEYICVAFASSASSISSDYANLVNLAVSRAQDENVYGVNEKLILACTSSVIDAGDFEEIPNFVVKYSAVLGAEMTIAAYLSQINTYGNDTVFDYAFTQENIAVDSTIDNSTFEQIIGNNMNVDVTLGGVVRNCGGNCVNGDSISNTFVRIVLQQTLSQRLLQALGQKLKNQSGVNKLYSVIAEELDRYLVDGYLTTDKIWKEDDLVITYGRSQFTIIEKGTALDSGYFVKILPLSSLTEEDRAIHSTPPIYILLAEQYGIRKIQIKGYTF